MSGAIMSPELRSILEAIAYVIALAFVLYSRHKTSEQRKQVHADLTAHKQTVALQAEQQKATLTDELSRKYTADLERVKTELTARVETLSTENTQLSHRLDNAAHDIANERDRNRQLETALHERKEEIALLQKQVSALEDVIKEMREQRDRSIEALGTALEREKSMQARIETLERELGELKIKNIQLEAELRAYKSIVEPFFAQVAGAFKPPTPPPADPMPLPEAA